MTSMSKPPVIIQCILAVNTDWDIVNSDDECEDYATQFDGPSPPSPSASLAHFNQNIFIKQEPRDTEGAQGMLDLWEPLDSSSKDCWSHCKSCWLHQLVTNLVGNAIKFTPSKISSKGHVVLSTRLLMLDDSSVTLKFCVLDTSIDKLNLIFDTFCQADGSTIQVSASIALCHLSLIRLLLQEYGDEPGSPLCSYATHFRFSDIAYWAWLHHCNYHMMWPTAWTMWLSMTWLPPLTCSTTIGTWSFWS